VKKIFLDKIKLGETLGASKVIRNQLDYCELFVIQLGETNGNYLLFLFQGKLPYFKLTPAFAGKWTCDNGLYNPEGLFGFIYEDEDIYLKIKNKLERLINIEVR